MAISFFDRSITSSLGKSNEVACPRCGEKTEMYLFENSDISFLALFLKKPDKEHFCVCPKCSCVFAVNEFYMEKRLQGTVCLLTESDLTELTRGKCDE